MKIKAILFDLDGTLRDTRDAIYEAYRHAIKTHSGRDASDADIKPHVHHHTVVHQAFADHVGLEEFEETYAAAVDPAIEKAQLYAGAKDLVASLQQEGYKIAIVTSATQHKVEEYLQNTGLAPFCEVIVGMAAGRKPKPDPDMLERALQGLGCSTDESVMVGDMTVDVLAAHAAGLRCVGITHGFASREELEEVGTDYITDSLAEVPRLITNLQQ